MTGIQPRRQNASGIVDIDKLAQVKRPPKTAAGAETAFHTVVHQLVQQTVDCLHPLGGLLPAFSAGCVARIRRKLLQDPGNFFVQLTCAAVGKLIVDRRFLPI